MNVTEKPGPEPMTTVTVSMQTADIIRRLVGRMQSLTGETITQRMIVDAAILAYLKRIEEDTTC